MLGWRTNVMHNMKLRFKYYSGWRFVMMWLATIAATMMLVACQTNRAGQSPGRSNAVASLDASPTSTPTVSPVIDKPNATNTGNNQASNAASKTTPAAATGTRYNAPQMLAQLDNPAIDESSGIVASRRTPGIYWTHNDSGDGALIYAFDTRGQSRGTWLVSGAKAIDWEDIAIAPAGKGATEPEIYVGDIGDNGMKRKEIVVYRFVEPVIDNASTNGKAATAQASAIRLRYPDGAHDAEALLVHPMSGDIYIIAKTFATTTGVYQASAASIAANTTAGKDQPTTMERVAELRLPNALGNLITGGEISSDGRGIVLCDYLRGYEIELPPSTSTNDFNQIWRQPIASFDIGARQQGEAICYRADGQAVLTTSEKLPTPLYQVTRNPNDNR